MERCSSKCDHHAQPHLSSTNRQPGRHRLSQTEQRISKHLERPSVHDKLSKTTLDNRPLSGDDDYIRSWLAQTNKEVEAETNNSPSPEERIDSRDANDKLQLNLQSLRDISQKGDNAEQQHHKRRHRYLSASDSSLVEAVLKTEPKPGKRELKSDFENQDEPLSRHSKKRQVVPLESGSSVESHIRHETFEKRARHKTRDDLYEPKKKKRRSDNQDVEKKSKKKREKKGDKRRAAKRAGEDLMNNFASDKVTTARLTIRPHGPGLFNNGRASSPARRRGLPDLVFSEMEFLQHPPQQVELPTTLKSREKKKQKVFRDRDEISMFFKPMMTSLAETGSNFRERSSTYMTDQQLLHTIQGLKDWSPSNTFDSVNNRHSKTGRPAVSSERLSASLGRKLNHQLSIFPNGERKSSENTTAVVTWSATQVSPGTTAVSKRQRVYCQNHQSPTPEPIRRSIESTGIFKDTGIERRRRSISSLEEPLQSHEICYQRQHLRSDQDSPEYTNQNTFKPTMAFSDWKQSCVDGYLRNIHHQLQPLHEIATRNRSSTQDPVPKDTLRKPSTTEVAPQQGNVVMEHSCPKEISPQHEKIGQMEGILGETPTNIELVEESKNTPLTRQQIAKRALIKRPAPTTPARTIARDPGHQPATDGHDLARESARKPLPIDVASTKPILQQVLAKTPDLVANGQVTWSPSLEAPMLIHHTHGMQSPGEIEVCFPVQKVPSVYSTTQDAALLEGVSREEDFIPPSRYSTPRVESPKLEAGFIAGLPMRGPSGRSLRWPSRHLNIFNGSETAPLYLNQIRRQYSPQQSDFKNIRKSQMQNYGALAGSGMVLYSAEDESGMSQEQMYETHGCEEYSPYDNPEDKYYAESVNLKSQIWQPSNQDGDSMLLYEPRDELEPHNGDDFSYRDDGFAQTFVDEPGMVDEYQFAEAFPMAGFWRRNRPF